MDSNIGGFERTQKGPIRVRSNSAVGAGESYGGSRPNVLRNSNEHPLLSSTDDEDNESLDDGELADSLLRAPVGIETPVAPSSPADSLPEEVTDDDIFGEEDFEVLERAFPADDSPYWDVEEVHDIEDEESPPRKVLRDPGEPSKQELEEHRIDHNPGPVLVPILHTRARNG